MLKKLYEIITDLLDPLAVKQKRRTAKNIRSIVARRSRGNISLQQGNYITAEDIARVKAENRKYRFAR